MTENQRPKHVYITCRHGENSLPEMRSLEYSEIGELYLDKDQNLYSVTKEPTSEQGFVLHMKERRDTPPVDFFTAIFGGGMRGNIFFEEKPAVEWYPPTLFTDPVECTKAFIAVSEKLIESIQKTIEECRVKIEEAESGEGKEEE